MKYSVVIIARNEEKNIGHVLESLSRQSIKPSQVIVVIDNPTKDNTAYIVSRFPMVSRVLFYPEPHDNWVTRPELAKVFNYGLAEIDTQKIGYVSILGADHILGSGYYETVIGRMENEDVAVASGAIKGEVAIVPRGSGRLIRTDFWEMIGKKLPVNYGYETYVVMKAQQLGYNVRYYSDILTDTMRKTAIVYKPVMFYHYGYAMRALGFPFMHTFLRAVMLLKRGKGIRSFASFMKGYNSNKDTFYEEPLRSFIAEKFCFRNTVSDPRDKIHRFIRTKY